LRPDGRVCLIDWGDAGIYSEGLDFETLKRRDYLAPEFTSMLLERIPRYDEFAEKPRRLIYALTTGQYIEYIPE
jgi:hypothetical protein